MRWLLIALLLMLRPAGADRPTTETLRIVTGAPNLTEIVYALGAGEQLVGVSTFTNHPPEAAALPAVIDLFHPNFEVLLQANPDLVFLLSSHGKVREFLDDHTEIEVMMLGELESLAQIDAAILAVGSRLGREQVAHALVEELNRPFAIANPENRRRPRCLLVVGYGPGLSQLYAVGRGTYLHELLEASGVENVVPDGLGKYPVLDKEALMRMDPEIILRVSDPGKGAELVETMRREWRALASITAVRRGDFRIIEDRGVMTPGPRARRYLALFQAVLREGGAGATAGPLGP